MGLAYNPKTIGDGDVVEVLYCVPVNGESNAAVAAGVLSGQTAIDTSTTPANGVSALSQPFIPVNGPIDSDGDGATEDSTLALRRAQCLRLVDRDHDSDNTVERVAFTVYANP